MRNAELTDDLAVLSPETYQTLQVALSGFFPAFRVRVQRMFLQKTAVPAGSEALILALEELIVESVADGLLAGDSNARVRRNALMRVLLEADTAALRSSAEAAGTSESEEMLTSEGAAKLLNVSRPHLNKLLDAGLIPGVEKSVGGHRRVPKSQVLRYKAATKQRQAHAAREVSRISAELGLYDDELEGLPVTPEAP